MKELYTDKQWTLAILDDKNYVIYNNTKPIVNKKTEGVSYKCSYFSQMKHAITELSRRLANDACHDLASWVNELDNAVSRIENAVCV